MGVGPHLSAARGHCYAGPGNRFWELLWEAGLTGDRILIPEQDAQVLSFGAGLTDVAKAVAASTDSRLRAGDFEVPAFLAKIERFKPGCVAFNGKKAPGIVAKYLRQPVPDHGPTAFTIAGSAGWVLPSSSASNNDPARFAPRATKAEWWREFGGWLRKR
jgi:TDG/mug DNA glycosylase family protein